MKITVNQMMEHGTADDLFRSLDATLKATGSVTDALLLQDLDEALRGIIKATGVRTASIMKECGGEFLPAGGINFLAKAPAEETSEETAARLADANARCKKFEKLLEEAHAEEVTITGDFPVSIRIQEDKLLELLKSKANKHLAPFLKMESKGK